MFIRKITIVWNNANMVIIFIKRNTKHIKTKLMTHENTNEYVTDDT